VRRPSYPKRFLVHTAIVLHWLCKYISLRAYSLPLWEEAARSVVHSLTLGEVRCISASWRGDRSHVRGSPWTLKVWTTQLLCSLFDVCVLMSTCLETRMVWSINRNWQTENEKNTGHPKMFWCVWNQRKNIIFIFIMMKEQQQGNPNGNQPAITVQLQPQQPACTTVRDKCKCCLAGKRWQITEHYCLVIL